MAIAGKKGQRVSARERIKLRIRKRVSGSVERPRVTVFRSAKHIYAQVVCDETATTIAAASTIEKDVVELATKLAPKVAEGEKAPTDIKRSTKSVMAARAVGLVLAKRLLEKKVDQVVFDRNGFLYHGRVAAVADGAREGGIKL